MSAAAGTAGEGAERDLAGGARQHLRPSRDAHAGLRRAVAILGALLLHASLLSLLLLTPEEEPPPPPLTVELVAAAPPIASATARAEPAPPSPVAGVNAPRASGGERERDVGEPPQIAAPDAASPQPAPAPAKDEAPVSAPPSPPSASKLAAAQAERSEAAFPLPLPPEAKPAPKPEQASVREASAPPQLPANAKSETATLGQSGGDRYLNKLHDEIERNRSYPAAGRALGLKGTAQYAMLIDRQGRLLRLRLLHSSGAEILDKAGMEMIERSAPFSPLPSEWIGEQLELVVTLHLAP